MITTLIICVSVIAAFYFGYRLGRTSYVTEYDLRQELRRMIEEKARLTIQRPMEGALTYHGIYGSWGALDSELGKVGAIRQLGEVEAPKRKRGRPRKNLASK